ncbi:NgoMIV family type II restriction endonuclease [Rhodovulum sulfidophilum]|uniref:NgoMIV family type II restriction endonuclease n=1 Tax=Rhodovulum sulfidophilum TaxID=35806 RepID=UPI0019242E55|nr:hypothetical protein [Rhodovulum sulfidophilum]
MNVVDHDEIEAVGGTDWRPFGIEYVALERAQEREALELIETMIEGQRLRDIADLPLD